MKFVAYDEDRAIWGLSGTPAGALEEAAVEIAGSMCPGADALVLQTAPATPALVSAINARGGDITWVEKADGTAALPSYEAIATDRDLWRQHFWVYENEGITQGSLPKEEFIGMLVEEYGPEES